MYCQSYLVQYFSDLSISSMAYLCQTKCSSDPVFSRILEKVSVSTRPSSYAYMIDKRVIGHSALQVERCLRIGAV